MTEEKAKLSLSARRAWIEIVLIIDEAGMVWSLSARRAWIEIVFCFCYAIFWRVALRKESVDRNMTWGAKKYATT